MSSLWDRYQQFLVRDEGLSVSIDVNQTRLGGDFPAQTEKPAQRAFSARMLSRTRRGLSGSALTGVQIGAVLGEDSEAVDYARDCQAVDNAAGKPRGATAVNDTFAFAG